MRAITPQPNLLIVGAPKSGTTSLLMWLRTHTDVYHPWLKAGDEAVESGFLIAGPSEIPISPLRPKGTLLLPHETDVDGYRGETWIIDKSPQHLYSRRALDSVRDLMPESRVIITLRDPFDLLISLYTQMWKTVDYQTSFEELFEMMESQDWIPDPDVPETWSFLTYPRYAQFVREWASELDPERVRVITLGSIAGNPTGVLRDLSDWLGISEGGMPRNPSVKNSRGKLSNSPIRKFLRDPPSWVFSTARLLMPSRAIRRRILDPIRRAGWKHVPAEKPHISSEMENTLRERLRVDSEFFQNLSSELPDGIIVD